MNLRLRADRNPTASALFGVGGLQILVGAVAVFVYKRNSDLDLDQLRWFLYSFHVRFDWLDWVFGFSGAIYIALGLASLWVRLPAALLGAGIYVALLAFQVSQNPNSLEAGVITKVLVFALLLVAIATALKRSPSVGRH
jgi:hypothetical protein